MISTTSWASCWLAFSRISRRARALKKKPDTIKFSVKSLKKKPCWGLRLVKLRKNGQQKRATNSEKRVEKICWAFYHPRSTNQVVASYVNTQELDHLLQNICLRPVKNAQQVQILLQRVELLSPFCNMFFATYNNPLICCKRGLIRPYKTNTFFTKTPESWSLLFFSHFLLNRYRICSR